ncbi:PP0621 family protein [Rhodoferax antarcticus]|uniref:Uncharacterized protein n=1 Tax=Rhodoferax antarcticus ANT.BR TaxID=1111071 RepID=A0A1Q8YCN5_9BURK|nr:PP0621 family protein [Rhodoferax antarcticus]APW45715.1 hypothetical protein RA876_04295 [Rhodoferax antarcticus]MCW2310810.1 uncharacterized protein [Rhodoferax antarcticus]OLP05762.1 hypothetical protein BLL52_1988 [Rhodoferax antarcticus ANT.BR]
MRGLLLLAAVLVIVWLWRSRAGSVKPDRATRAAEPQLEDMVRCQQCGLHLPAADAITGRQGSYCCAEHLQLSES